LASSSRANPGITARSEHQGIFGINSDAEFEVISGSNAQNQATVRATRVVNDTIEQFDIFLTQLSDDSSEPWVIESVSPVSA